MPRGQRAHLDSDMCARIDRSSCLPSCELLWRVLLRSELLHDLGHFHLFQELRLMNLRSFLHVGCMEHLHHLGHICHFSRAVSFNTTGTLTILSMNLQCFQYLFGSLAPVVVSRLKRPPFDRGIELVAFSPFSALFEWCELCVPSRLAPQQSLAHSVTLVPVAASVASARLER